MKRLLFTIILCFCVSINAQELVDGEKGGNIQICKSAIYDLIGVYGHNYELKKHIDYSNVLGCEKLGLSFLSCQITVIL